MRTFTYRNCKNHKWLLKIHKQYLYNNDIDILFGVFFSICTIKRLHKIHKGRTKIIQLKGFIHLFSIILRYEWFIL